MPSSLRHPAWRRPPRPRSSPGAARGWRISNARSASASGRCRRHPPARSRNSNCASGCGQYSLPVTTGRNLMHRRALLAAPALLALPAQAQPWSPDRPIRILVPYTPGAINDTLARLIGEKMGDALGQLGVVENRPGASGSLAIAATAQAAPDGTTIVVANTANLAMNPFLFANTGYDSQKDLTPLAVCARVMNALVVPEASPFRTLAELVAHAKANPGRMSYASSGAGSSPHLAAELFKH